MSMEKLNQAGFMKGFTGIRLDEHRHSAGELCIGSAHASQAPHLLPQCRGLNTYQYRGPRFFV